MGRSVADREFIAWPKIARLANEHMTISEKCDGTNACIVITEDDIYCQSRNRLIEVGNDNAGFAKWVDDWQHALRMDLGIGRFYGEWYGLGIQRNYGLDHKRFALFNTYRWAKAAPYFETPNLGVVPVLYEGAFNTDVIRTVHGDLMDGGSHAVEGWNRPEGIVVYLAEARVSYKITDAVAGPSKPRLATE